MASHLPIVVRALSWNLFHGRDFPPDPGLFTWRSRLLRRTERNATHAQVNRPLLEEFSALLARREWDIALLQEAPPRWQRALAERTRSSAAIALTSRNWCSFARGRLADWNPDLMASGEGGSNQLLVRAPARISEVRRLTLARLPERRRMLWARLELHDGRSVCVGNLHASRSETGRTPGELLAAAERAVDWAGGDPLVLGGDFNVRPKGHPQLYEALRERFGLTGALQASVDQLLVRGLEQVEPAVVLPPEEREVTRHDSLRIRLSDHAPVVGSFGMK